MKKILEQFIKLYSEKKPKLEDIILYGIDEVTARELLRDYELKMKFDQIILEDNLLETFFYNIYTKGLSIFNFTFYEHLKYSEGFTTFGHVDTYNLIEFRNTNEIALYLDYAESIYYLSESFEAFLGLLLILVEYDATDFQKNISIKENNKKFSKRIIKHLKKKKYYKYFTDMLR